MLGQNLHPQYVHHNSIERFHCSHSTHTPSRKNHMFVTFVIPLNARGPAWVQGRLVPSPTPSFSSLAVRYTASDEKLGMGLGTRLGTRLLNPHSGGNPHVLWEGLEEIPMHSAGGTGGNPHALCRRDCHMEGIPMHSGRDWRESPCTLGARDWRESPCTLGGTGGNPHARIPMHSGRDWRNSHSGRALNLWAPERVWACIMNPHSGRDWRESPLQEGLEGG